MRRRRNASWRGELTLGGSIANALGSSEASSHAGSARHGADPRMGSDGTRVAVDEGMRTHSLVPNGPRHTLRRRRGTFVAMLSLAAAGCLDRPVTESEPLTTNVFLEQVTIDKLDKLDLVFMIDNSVSMADKQQILGNAVPELLRRFIVPICVDERGVRTAQRATAEESCPEGSAPEFDAVRDIHIAVISSSLGAHGGTYCSREWSGFNDTMDDRGRLIAPTRELAPTTRLHPAGFLEWTGGDAAAIAAFIESFRDVVLATGEEGCGFEASLEAWYRFLIDPEPPLKVTFDAATKAVVASGIDTDLLAQRAEFLRPDSLVGVVMLSDENDCSLRDDGASWLITGMGGVPRARAVCKERPDDPCCTSCGDLSAEQRCGPSAADPECALGPYPQLEEPAGLRCFEQKRRFGLDLLYPTQRYAEGLSKATVIARSGAELPNPLYAASERYPELTPRMPGTLVYLAGIVGVPWQDLAETASLSDPDTLIYKPAKKLDFSLFLGDPSKRELPADPFMRESVDPRTGQNPVTLDSIAKESSSVPFDMTVPSAAGSWINGHEFTDPQRKDLQYACIFPLAEPQPCPAPDGGGCDCDGAATDPPNNPLCQRQGTATSGTTQYFAKAYPGLRFLDVLKQYGENSIVASVCPKITDTGSQYGGYQPAVAAIVDRLKEAFRGACLPRPLRIGSDGKVICQVVEATLGQGDTCTGDARAELDPAVSAAVRKRLGERGHCGEAGKPDCEALRLCKLNGLTPGTPEHNRCLNDLADDVGANGYCYIDQTLEQPIGNRELVKSCDPTQKRMLRFVRTTVDPVPAERSNVFMACLGDSTAEE